MTHIRNRQFPLFLISFGLTRLLHWGPTCHILFARPEELAFPLQGPTLACRLYGLSNSSPSPPPHFTLWLSKGLDSKTCFSSKMIESLITHSFIPGGLCFPKTKYLCSPLSIQIPSFNTYLCLVEGPTDPYLRNLQGHGPNVVTWDSHAQQYWAQDQQTPHHSLGNPRRGNAFSCICSY